MSTRGVNDKPTGDTPAPDENQIVAELLHLANLVRAREPLPSGGLSLSEGLH